MATKLTPQQAWHDYTTRIYLPENWKTVSREMRGQIAQAIRRNATGQLTDFGIESIINRTKPDWYTIEKKIVFWKK